MKRCLVEDNRHVVPLLACLKYLERALEPEVRYGKVSMVVKEDYERIGIVIYKRQEVRQQRVSEERRRRPGPGCCSFVVFVFAVLKSATVDNDFGRR